jgi:hypothetical protein
MNTPCIAVLWSCYYAQDWTVRVTRRDETLERDRRRMRAPLGN